MSFKICVINLILFMNIGTLLFNVDDEYRKEFRTYEKKVKKLYNAKSRLQFNQICYDNDLQPKYTHFKLYDEAANGDGFVTDFRRNLISREIKKNEDEISLFDSEVNTLYVLVKK